MNSNKYSLIKEGSLVIVQPRANLYVSGNYNSWMQDDSITCTKKPTLGIYLGIASDDLLSFAKILINNKTYIVHAGRVVVGNRENWIASQNNWRGRFK